MRHPVEERLERLLAIMAGTAGRGPVSLRELADRHRVTVHQLQKDLLLAMDMGIPPYEYEHETPLVELVGDRVEVTVPPHFAQQQQRLTRPQAFAVVAAGRAALALDPGLDDLRAALDVLGEALGLPAEGDVEVEIEVPPHLDAVRAAVAGRRRIVVGYWSAWRDEMTERTLDPLLVVFVDGEWYLRADDHRSGERRHFRVDRITAVEETGEGFDTVDLEPFTEPFVAPSFAVDVTVRFPTSARWILDYLGAVVTADEGADGFTAVLTSVGDVWLGRILLRTAGQVLAPAELVDLRSRTARAVLARYDG